MDVEQVFFGENIVRFALPEAAVNVWRKIKQFYGILPAALNSISSNCYEEQNEVSILCLNEYCLLHIFKYLDLSDQISLAISCQQMSDIFARFCKVKYKFLETSDLQCLTELQVEALMKIIEPHLEKLLVSWVGGNYINFLQILARFCSNVKYLEVDDGECCKVQNLLEKMPLLEELVFHDLCYVEDDFIHNFKNMANLKHLHIMYMSTTEHIPVIQLPNGLETLTLHIEHKPLNNALEGLINLKYLEITYLYEELQTEDFEYIATNLLQLETLKIKYTSGNFSCLPKLPKLRELYIADMRYSPNMSIYRDFFFNVEKYLVNQLEEFGIGTYDENLEIGTFVSKLTWLKVIRWKCYTTLNTCERIELFANLSALEEFYCYQQLSSDFILKLLKNCPKLRKVQYVASLDVYDIEIFKKASKLLQKQVVLSIRDQYVELTIPLPICKSPYRCKSYFIENGKNSEMVF